MEDQSFIDCLLVKRRELVNLNAELRKKNAIVANDIEAVERVLDSIGYQGQLVGNTPRAARIVLLYRNELRECLLAELRKTGEPLTARELACRLCQVEGKGWQDRQLKTNMTRRVGCALRKMRAGRVIEGGGRRPGRCGDYRFSKS